MRVTRATAVVLALVYVFFWVVALNGASSFIPLLAVPAILAVLVAFGVWLNRFMGITPRAQHFAERGGDAPASPSDAAPPVDDESTGSGEEADGSAPRPDATDDGPADASA